MALRSLDTIPTDDKCIEFECNYIKSFLFVKINVVLFSDLLKLSVIFKIPPTINDIKTIFTRKKPT